MTQHEMNRALKKEKNEKHNPDLRVGVEKQKRKLLIIQMIQG